MTNFPDNDWRPFVRGCTTGYEQNAAGAPRRPGARGQHSESLAPGNHADFLGRRIAENRHWQKNPLIAFGIFVPFAPSRP
jgi:hypothetical protein